MLDKLVDTFARFSNNITLEIKILGITLGFIILFGTGITFEMRNIVYNLLLDELDKQGQSIASDLSARSADLVLTSNDFNLHLLLRHTVANNDAVKYAFIINDKNEIVGHSFNDGFPIDLKDIHGSNAYEKPSKILVESDSMIIHDFSIPIIDGKVGIARVGLDESNVNESIRKITNTIIQTTLVMALVGIIAAYLLAHLVSRPIHSLVQATRKFSEGDYSQRVEIYSNDDVGKLGIAFNEMGESLETKEQENQLLISEVEKKEQLRRSLLKKVMTAQELERKRISRELHDETGQLLSSLMLHLRHIKDSGYGEDFDTNVENMRTLINKTITEVKRMSYQLRPSVLDDMGLISAIERLIKEYRDVLQIEIDLIVHGKQSEQRMLTELEIAIYRILQEALTNIYKYAHAENVSIILTFRQETVQLIIEDDGVGFNLDLHLKSDATDNHLGLHGMRERAELFNGTFEIESQKDMGTTIYVTIPIVYEE